MSGWIVSNGSIDVNGEEVHSGLYSVHGTSGGDESEGEPAVTFHRVFSLTGYTTWIEAGLGVATYEGWLHNGNSEYYRYIVRFYDDNDVRLSNYDTGWIRDAGGGYHQHGETRTIPVNAAYVRVEAQMKR